MSLRKISILLIFTGLCVACQQKTGSEFQPFAEAKELVCPEHTQRIEVRETSYPEFYCVGFEGRVGTWLEYDESGRLRKRAEYQKDKMNGEWLAFHPNGMIETRGQMSNDNRTGEWTQYYINGQLRSEKTYADNQLDGPIKLYYQDGKLMAEGKYITGIEEGPWKVYTPEGLLARECNLIHGEEKDCVVHVEDFKITSFEYESKERGPL